MMLKSFGAKTPLPSAVPRWEFVLTIGGECVGPPSEDIVRAWVLSHVTIAAAVHMQGPVILNVQVREKLSGAVGST
jgi:hypothetical protein